MEIQREPNRYSLHSLTINVQGEDRITGPLNHYISKEADITVEEILNRADDKGRYSKNGHVSKIHYLGNHQEGYSFYTGADSVGNIYSTIKEENKDVATLDWKEFQKLGKPLIIKRNVTYEKSPSPSAPSSR
jgi:hypothetical protein